jgi:hypothetical protein
METWTILCAPRYRDPHYAALSRIREVAPLLYAEKRLSEIESTLIDHERLSDKPAIVTFMLHANGRISR